MITELIYDQPIEVTEKQYKKAMNDCSGLVAGQEKDGKFFIKLWVTKYRKYVLSTLNS